MVAFDAQSLCPSAPLRAHRCVIVPLWFKNSRQPKAFSRQSIHNFVFLCALVSLWPNRCALVVNSYITIISVTKGIYCFVCCTT